MGGGGKKVMSSIASVATGGLYDVAKGNKPLEGAKQLFGKSMVAIAGESPAVVKREEGPVEGEVLGGGLTSKRGRTKTSYGGMLGGYSSLAKKMLLGE
jgi:hypothetical protein